jgi:hypothetical protein
MLYPLESGAHTNKFAITPLLNLGVPLHELHQLATKLHCHCMH